MDPKLFLKLAPERRLCLALQHALGVLQMSQMELSQWLQEEVEKNPLLELKTRGSPKSFVEEIASPPNLHDHLLTQIRDHFASLEERKMAERFIHALDERGFLEGMPDELSPYSAKILSILQTFDPPGVFARDLREALLIQLKALKKEGTLAYSVVDLCFDDLLHGRYSKVEKKLKTTHLAPAIRDLSTLSMRPVSSFRQTAISVVKPDLRIEKVEGGWTLELIEEEWPAIRTEYLPAPIDANPEEKEALSGFKSKAKEVMRAFEERKKLLRSIGRIFVKRQTAFLSQKGPLKELSAKELAESSKCMNPLCRARFLEKYVATPRGVLPLKALITSSPEAANAKELLERLLRGEDRQNPFTDEELAQKLKAKGYSIARRTIAKYRSQLKRGSAAQRKRV